MLPSIKNAGSTKAKVLSKREEKKGINIRSNSGLFFQIGLIASLMFVIAIVNIDFKINNDLGYQINDDLDLDEVPIINWKMESVKPVEPVKQKVVKSQPRKKITSVLREVDDNSKLTESKVEPTSTTSEEKIVPIAATQPVVVNKGPETLRTVDLVPTFPGCESLQNNEERLACLSSKLHKFIGRKFNTEKYSEKYAGKTNRIHVQFTIDKGGNIVDIKARAPGKDLEDEAKKVISKLPLMEPGQKNDQNVAVIYQIPIVFTSSY